MLWKETQELFGYPYGMCDVALFFDIKFNRIILLYENLLKYVKYNLYIIIYIYMLIVFIRIYK